MPPTTRRQLRGIAVYRRWGLWHDDESLKLTAIRPGAWLLRQVPELRVRALVGPSLESDLVTLALAGPLTARISPGRPASHMQRHTEPPTGWLPVASYAANVPAPLNCCN